MNREAYWGATRRQWNVANAVTLSRALSVALIPFGVLVGDEWLGLLVFYAALSDWLDGWLARRFNQHTAIGSIADPLADKVFTDIFLVYATVSTGSWWVAILAGVTLLYDIDNTYQRRIDIANAFKGIATPSTMPVNWLSKTKTASLFVFMLAVIYPDWLLYLTIDQLAYLCLVLVLSSWCVHRRKLIRSFVD